MEGLSLSLSSVSGRMTGGLTLGGSKTMLESVDDREWEIFRASCDRGGRRDAAL